ncbi:MAG: hypothetical protein EB127_17635 [Alphaproteobacteria bacterium]|nr:hypothetical protein [Alphaproteobacteria bacterium]
MATEFLRQKYARPSLIIFTETEPQLKVEGSNIGKWDLGTNYLYLSDDNRSELAISFERIEHRQRMINGTMRSYHIADKKTYSTSWKKLPSRKDYVTEYLEYTRTNFAGGQQLLDWYNNHSGSFWALFVYDYSDDIDKTQIKKNVEKINVFFESFSYNIVTRGLDTDLWDINLSLVEV